MRVICIDSEAWPVGLPICDTNGKIRNGKSYDIVDVYFEDGYIWYEISADPNFGYWENCFARTSSIDETQMTRENIQELTNIS